MARDYLAFKRSVHGRSSRLRASTNIYGCYPASLILFKFFVIYISIAGEKSCVIRKIIAEDVETTE